MIIILVALHGLAAVCFLLLARKSSLLVDETGRPIPERRDARELTYRIAPMTPENKI